MQGVPREENALHLEHSTPSVKSSERKEEEERYLSKAPYAWSWSDCSVFSNFILFYTEDEINVPMTLSVFRDGYFLLFCIEGLYSPVNRTGSPQGFLLVQILLVLNNLHLEKNQCKNSIFDIALVYNSA